MCIFKGNKADVVLFLFIIYVNFLVHNLNYPYIYSYKEWLCFFSLVGVSDLGFWGPLGYLCGFWPTGSHLFSLKVESFCGGLCRRLIFELIVVAVILACLGFWFWMARLVLPCKGAGLARTGLLGLVSSAPVNTYFSFPQSWFCVCMCVFKKKKKKKKKRKKKKLGINFNCCFMVTNFFFFCTLYYFICSRPIIFSYWFRGNDEILLPIVLFFINVLSLDTHIFLWLVICFCTFIVESEV